jgi:preprotein translocase subunit SecG
MVRTALLTLWLLALSAPAALAYPGQDQGNGLYGPANDKVVTNAAFILIAAFPVLVLLLSLLQNALENRKDRRLAAAKARRARADLRGGW